MLTDARRGGLALEMILGVTATLTCDQHFQQAGFQLLMDA